MVKNPESRGFRENTGEKIPKLKIIPNPEEKKSRIKIYNKRNKNPEVRGFSENPEKIPTVRIP